jgi:hypothetical protein
MHAIVVRVSINDVEAATTFLRERIVPGISQAPGFVTGHWVQWGDPSQGAAMMVFESEDAANQAKGMIQPPPGNAVTIESVEVGEVVATA